MIIIRKKEQETSSDRTLSKEICFDLALQRGDRKQALITLYRNLNCFDFAL